MVVGEHDLDLGESREKKIKRKAVLFSQNESATSNQPQPANSTLLSEQTSTSHQPPANRTGWETVAQ
jgi:hypothetical protein